ncbi:MAG: hypothetical protein HKN36_10295 [Hellea sp.]|nr:hypothetical protein [Hellea sp.]
MGRIKISIYHVICTKTATALRPDDLYFISTLKCVAQPPSPINVQDPIIIEDITHVSLDKQINTGYRGKLWQDPDNIVFQGECDDEHKVCGSVYFVDRVGKANERKDLSQRIPIWPFSYRGGGKAIAQSILGLLSLGTGAMLGALIAAVIATSVAGWLLLISSGGLAGLLWAFAIIAFLEFSKDEIAIDDYYLGAIAICVAVEPHPKTSRINFRMNNATNGIELYFRDGTKKYEFNADSGHDYNIKFLIERS